MAESQPPTTLTWLLSLEPRRPSSQLLRSSMLFVVGITLNTKSIESVAAHDPNQEGNDTGGTFFVALISGLLGHAPQALRESNWSSIYTHGNAGADTGWRKNDDLLKGG